MSDRTKYLAAVGRLTADLTTAADLLTSLYPSGDVVRAGEASVLSKTIPTHLFRPVAEFIETVILLADDSIGALSAQQRKDVLANVLSAMTENIEAPDLFKTWAEDNGASFSEAAE